MIVAKRTDASKTRFARAEALRIARQAALVVSIRGRGVQRFALRLDPADDDTLARSLLGPTGNLRAPALRIGKTLVVGFDADVWLALICPEVRQRRPRRRPST